MFIRSKGEGFYFSLEVPDEIMEEWMPRATQIVMIELLAPIVANECFKKDLEGATVLLFVDSEAVEGALVKGYSSKDDLCWLTSVFWDQALKLRALFYIDRVATDANPGDGPSRGRDREARACRWKWIRSYFPEVVIEGLGKFTLKMVDLPLGT